MSLYSLLQSKVSESVSVLYGANVPSENVLLSETRKEFEGDFTVTVFSLAKSSGKSPDQTASEIGVWLQENCAEVFSFNVIKGFLNLVIEEKFWIETLNQELSPCKPTGKTIMVEYSSPNTNKPLHLGHVRNNLLGHSICELLSAAGNKVIKVNLVNDRGVHICKSMLAWKLFGNNESPSSSGMKGDKLVGKYYVIFDKKLKEELAVLGKGDDDDAVRNTELMKQVQDMLRKWEAGDEETIALWKKMNAWVYDGFDVTYKTMGITFDKIYYESNTYLLGKKIVEEGLERNVFEKESDQSVWVDLAEFGLERKVLQRKDGTSLYMTQDIGTVELRFNEFHPDKIIYIVGNEQDYHFKVLKAVIKKLGRPWADEIHHLSYGMVDLPSGKMKSREGTVVDADDLMEEMILEAGRITAELGKTEGLSTAECTALYKNLGMGALKFFILKVDPKKRMLFNPKESIDFNGHTGPFIQYTHARIYSLLRKADELKFDASSAVNKEMLEVKEKDLLRYNYRYEMVLQEAASSLSPALMANYAYELARSFNSFYHEHSILKEEQSNIVRFRLKLSARTAKNLKSAMHLLGIELPERM